MFFFSLAVMFALALTLPLLALVFFALAERYSTRVAYVVLAALPLTSFVLLLKLQQYLGHLPDTLFPVTLWLSLFLFIFGIVLTIRALKRKQGWGYLLMATIGSSIPFCLVVFMLYQMSQDEFLKHL